MAGIVVHTSGGLSRFFREISGFFKETLSKKYDFAMLNLIVILGGYCFKKSDLYKHYRLTILNSMKLNLGMFFGHVLLGVMISILSPIFVRRLVNWRGRFMLKTMFECVCCLGTALVLYKVTHPILEEGKQIIDQWLVFLMLAMASYTLYWSRIISLLDALNLPVLFLELGVHLMYELNKYVTPISLYSFSVILWRNFWEEERQEQENGGGGGEGGTGGDGGGGTDHHGGSREIGTGVRDGGGGGTGGGGGGAMLGQV